MNPLPKLVNVILPKLVIFILPLSLFCPVSMAIAAKISVTEYPLAKSMTDKFNVKAGTFSLDSKNAHTFPEGYTLSESHKQTLYQNGISVFQGPFEEMKEEVRKYFGTSVDLKPDSPNAINYFGMSESFSTPWGGKMAPWNGKDLMYAHGVGSFPFKESEAAYGVSFRVGNTRMTFSWPKEGHELSELSLDELFADDFSAQRMRLYAPMFYIKSDFKLITAASTVMEERQTAIFEFDSRGVRGKAVTATTNTPTASQPEEAPEVWIDRPFHFACTLNGTPLFMGTILNPAY